MNRQYDFLEEDIHEYTPTIRIPTIFPAILSSRTSLSCNNPILDLEKYLVDQKTRDQQRIRNLKDKQQFIGQKIQKTMFNKEKKLRQLEQQQIKKLLSECTFQPKTHCKKTSKRNLAQFLQQQNQFTKKVNEKTSNLKNKLQEEKKKQICKPKINKSSSTKKKNNIPVYERLYALKDKENDKNNSAIHLNRASTENNFHPKITQKSRKMNRNAPIQNLLYGDALRRQQKAKEVMNLINSSSPKFEKPLNINNEKYVAQRFIKEYFTILEKLEIPSSNGNNLPYLAFNEILQYMGFVKMDEQATENSISTQQRVLVNEAYHILEKYTVNVKNICVFLMGLIGVFHINPINFEEGEETIPEKQYSLDQSQGRKQQKHFDLLKRNRLSSQFTRKRSDNLNQRYEQHSFHPKTNRISQQMAERHRQNMLEEANKMLQKYPEIQFNIPENGMISHTDLLVLDNLAKEAKRQAKKQDLQNKKMQEYTFKPTTLNSSVNQTILNHSINSPNNIDLSLGLGNKKSMELYNNHRNLQSKKESLRASRQQHDLNLNQCTFAPNLNHIKIQEDTSKFNTKEVDQTLYRMRKGREQHQQKKKFLQRGEIIQKQSFQGVNSKRKQKKTIINMTNMAEQQDQQVPTLILDVNLGQKVDRIMLYDGDQERLPQVARAFAQKHNLDEENQAKLCELLQVELQNVLAQINQDEEGDDNQDENA